MTDEETYPPYVQPLGVVAAYEAQGLTPPPSLIRGLYMIAIERGPDDLAMLYEALLVVYPHLVKYFERIPSTDDDEEDDDGGEVFVGFPQTTTTMERMFT